MNGSYYQTPVFINDIERDTNNPIVDNFIHCLTFNFISSTYNKLTLIS